MSGRMHQPQRLWWLFLASVAVITAMLWAGRGTVRAAVDVLTGEPTTEPIAFSADWMQEWQDGREHVGLFRGNCQITQGSTTWTADKMVVWVESHQQTLTREDRILVYLEDRVVTRTADGTRSDSILQLEFRTTDGVDLAVRGRQPATDGSEDPLYVRASESRKGRQRGQLQPTQFTIDTTAQQNVPPGPDVGSMGGLRRVRIFPRSAIPFNIQSFRNNNIAPPEQVILLTGGVTLIVDGLDTVGTVDLSADRVVIWTRAFDSGEFSTESYQAQDAPYQVYLEKNIVIRQGDNVIRADRAYYDVREKRAIVYDAELKTYLPEDEVTIRVRADVIRQRSQENFHAQNAWVTTSQLGVPTYRVQSSDVFVEQRDWSPWSRPRVDPATGQVVPERHPWVTTQNNTFLFGEIPLFYTPSFSAPAEDPNIPIQSLTFHQDSIFGTQVRSRFDAFQLFGLQRPEDSRLSLELDYLSERGPLVGIDGTYRGEDAYGNSFFGNGLASYVHDSGNDNLGLDRRSLIPEDENRGRVRLQHRHQLPFGMELQGEVGFVSDRNFLEQYYENEFDRGKDQETYLRFQQKIDNMAWSVFGRVQTNPFENNTQWLPRADGYILGEPFANGLFSYSTHSYAGYASLEQASFPSDPRDVFTPLPYFADSQGVVAMTRHELEMPLHLGPLTVVPYALGEAAFWGDGLNGDAIDRFYGRGGVRGSMQFWKVFPYVQSDLFNLNGLAHRMIFDADYSYSQSTRSLSEIPQYNEFDDDAQERFRERFVTNTFGGTLPGQFDPRFYAVRAGAGDEIADPYHELVDDQQVLRLGWRNRLQTKVGPPDRLRVKDWMTLDTGISYFPDADRDNFGEDFGLLSAKYAWYVGDRTSLHASTLLDFFDDGQQLWSVGVLSQRSVRGSIYVGFRQVQGGPLNSQIVTASYSYTLSPKWVSTLSTAYDVGESRNRGQSATITRIGESFLVHVGANYDASKDNVGLAISVEPRLGNRKVSTTQLGPLVSPSY